MTTTTLANTCRLYLLRHGATNSNLAIPPRLQGRAIDDPLSVVGQDQARQAAEQLRIIPLAAVYCSPLKRSLETAMAVASHHQQTARTVAEITEVDVGRWERRTWKDIEADEPQAFRNFQDNPALHGYPEGESLTDVSQRVVPALSRIASEHIGQSIAVVGHNVVNRAFLATALELPLSLARNIHQANCCINIVEWQAGNWKVVAVNSIFHLADH